MLVASRVPMFRAPGRLHASEMLAVTSPVTPKNNHDTAVVIARPPKPVTLMVTNRFRQTESRPEEIDRAGLTVTIRENCCPRLFLGRK